MRQLKVSLKTFRESHESFESCLQPATKFRETAQNDRTSVNI